ncbi:MAG: zinc-binding dehydrogenase [Betaproteobacteria bacterium]|nr:zinc-binding dehydrogenase [Betaproteobacteria bacterium]
MPTLPPTSLQLTSRITPDGELELALLEAPVPRPGPDEVLIRIEGTPINPSDIGNLFGPADLATLRATGTPQCPALSARIPAAAMKGVAGRVGQAMPVGNEGAGTVVAAGEAPAAQALIGRLVAALAGGMYAQYRCVKAAEVLPLPEGTAAADAASCFVNPLTALGMVETMRREGHKALVHTAAASNLGQMLNRICIADGIGLVNIVRKPGQLELLRSQGAARVCVSSAPEFASDLAAACAATGATLAFDAVGGGTLASQILAAMETALNRGATEYSRYGSPVHKQVYLYGALDTAPTEIRRNFGMAWGVGGWLLFPFLQRIGPQAANVLKRRVASELNTTFASHYSRVVSLAQALDPEVVASYTARATGEKFLIDPSR